MTIRIEFPSIGATYAFNKYTVYQYGVYPRSSVNYGMQCRTFIDSFDTLDEARKAYPSAEECINDPIPFDNETN